MIQQALEFLTLYVREVTGSPTATVSLVITHTPPDGLQRLRDVQTMVDAAHPR